MGYLHIDNLYKNQTILMFRECYALEKIHGTSAHIAFKDGEMRFFSGGSKHANFVALFDEAILAEGFAAVGSSDVIIYGEAYGGKTQGMRDTYGDNLRFIVFDVKISGMWLAVPQMEAVAMALGLDVVPWERISTDMDAVDAARDRTSTVGAWRDCPDKKQEGVVLRPLIEMTLNNGSRVIVKHKRDDFSETKTPRKVTDEELEVLADAEEIAEEWVTPMRLTHVLDAMGGDVQIEQMGDILRAMVADVEREAAGEIVVSKAAKKAISRKTAQIFKQRLQDKLRASK